MITVSDKPTRSDRPGYPYLARGNSSGHTYLVLDENQQIVLGRGCETLAQVGDITFDDSTMLTPFQPGEFIMIRQV